MSRAENSKRFPELRRVIKVLWRRYRLLSIIALGVCMVLLLATWWSVNENYLRPSGSKGFLAAVLSSLAATSIWAGVTLIVSAKYFRIVNEWERLDSYPLESNVKSSRFIEVNVHGWDGLFCGRDGKDDKGVLLDNWKTTKRAQAWTNFFGDREARLTLILPKVPHEECRDWNEITDLLNLQVISNRTGKSVEAQKAEIVKTIDRARDLAITEDQVLVKFASDLRWIFTMKFDNDRALISPYTAMHKGPGRFEGPVFEMDPTLYPYLDSWIYELHLSDGRYRPRTHAPDGAGNEIANG